ncbi:MAG: alanine--tRNA ligase [Minisyncoccia bacterium]
MTSAEIRQKFLEFFKKKEHTVIPSASLIPENDPTVLFTTAGMHPLVPFLLGEVHPGGKRVASVQKCIRTGDIDEVGDDVHLTFFEMLGNWSFGDYWKEDAIKWSFEFLTKELKLPIKKLAVSCFAGDEDAPCDDESANIWESLGIPKERIYFLPKKDNWWGPAGETGPCGPDTEMFYWTGEGEPEPLTTGDNKEKWVEIWNDVFMQYDKRPDGTFKSLKQKNVDTGMGVERTVSVINGEDIFLIDTFKPLIECIEKLSGKKYKDEGETKRAMRIIADHVRAAAFIIGDENGISPSNIGQGYVLRRLVRRAIRYADQLGIQGTGLSVLVDPALEPYKEECAEMYIVRDSIKQEIDKEEAKFRETLKEGLKELEKMIGSGHISRIPPGQGNFEPAVNEVDPVKAFFIYQTYGFPFELIEEELAKRLLFVDKKKFDLEMLKHKDLSRTASAGMFEGGLADHSEKTTRLHTASHLLHQALIDVLGITADQKGSNITAERLRFDFACPRKLTPEEIKKVEDIVNGKIREDLPVHFELLTVDEAKSNGALGVFEEKYAKMDKVKVYFVGDYSKEICGGPHVTHTGEIGKFKITKEEASSAGVRRIRAVIE